MDKYFYEAFENMERLAPGSGNSTRKAMGLFPRKDEEIDVLDIGCGNGVQTILLAKGFPKSRITAIDINRPFIDNLKKSVVDEGLSERVEGKVASMLEMPFEEESFDLIWAEGSIYVAGFQNGLISWKKYLKEGGYIVCSEVVWLTDNPSRESRDFWEEEYPEIDTIENKIRQIEEAGYSAAGFFIMPGEDWSSFYDVLNENLEIMRKKYDSNEAALEVIEMMDRELAMYDAHSDEYGYAFFAMHI